jgi:putative transcriptional regulator
MKARIINHVRERRAGMGMTQEDLAQACGVSRQSINSIERGKYIPSLPLALRLAEVFGCATDDLFERKEAR